MLFLLLAASQVFLTCNAFLPTTFDVRKNGRNFIVEVKYFSSKPDDIRVILRPTPCIQSELQLVRTDKKEKDSVQKDMNPAARASWYAVEAFGKIFGSKEDKPNSSAMKKNSTSGKVMVDLDTVPSSIEEAFARIELDNKRSYFLSGKVDELAYDPDCVFSDPFVSFSGRDRFVKNLQNLGSFITAYDAKVLEYGVFKDGNSVKTKVMVKLELNLPWKPILAWPWGVTYKIDAETFLITSHEESWDIEPWEGVKQIFRKPALSIRKE